MLIFSVYTFLNVSQKYSNLIQRFSKIIFEKIKKYNKP